MNDNRDALLAAIQGPVLLITIGTLFALDQYSVLRFRQSWPIILIIAGILNLGRWSSRRQQP